MELLVLLFKSRLSMEEMSKISEKRVQEYRKVNGLLQKFYVRDPASGQVGGVFVFDSKENLEAFKKSDLAKSTAEVYKSLESPSIRVLEVLKVLYEQKERLL